MANVTALVQGSTVSLQPPAAIGGTASGLQIRRDFRANYAVSGTAADECDLNCILTLTFVSSTPQVIDLRACADRYGNAIVFARVRSIAIKNRGTIDAATLLVGYATTTAGAWTGIVSNPGQVAVYPGSTANPDGGFVVLACPNTTGAAVNSGSHLLQLDPGAHAFPVDVEINGCSA